MKMKFDPSDLDGMRKLMDELGDSTTMFRGENADEEETCLSIYPDRVVCTTYQNNGWVRQNTYWRDGTREETFDGRWKPPRPDGGGAE